METNRKFAEDLIDFLHESPTAYQTVRNIKAALLRKGFKQLHRGESWNLEKGKRYFATKNSTALIAFIVGEGEIETEGFRLIAAHTDSPSLKIKPEPVMKAKGNYIKLNVETYGGAVLSTWLDRPLSVAGRVAVRSKNLYRPLVKSLNIKKPIFIIPNLAIHLNREINDGKSFNKQIDLMPIAGLFESDLEKEDYLLNLIARHLNIEKTDILDFELNLYESDRGSIIGEHQEFISAGRIDDLSMVHAGVAALFDSDAGKATNVMVCYDNEEIGSGTKQGAASPFVKDVLRRVSWALSTKRDAFFRAKISSFGISADNAHAVHPNFPEKHDPVSQPEINKGPVIKYNADQKYATDALSAATFKMLCEKAGVPVQSYVNRSDIRGGSTLGSILSTQLDFRMVDVGNPMLAMHSIRELAGVKDHMYIKRVFDEFYKS